MKKPVLTNFRTRSLCFITLLIIAVSGCATKNFYPASPLIEPTSAEQVQHTGSVKVQAGRQYQHGRLQNFFLGKHYRDVWATPVQARVLQLDQEKGGLKMEKKGGSLQTLSFTLTDSAGRNYALRSVDKDPAGNATGLLKNTFAANFLRDQTAALNPYAALAVAPLARAAGIPQPDPELVYVRKSDPALGEFQDLAADRLYLLENKFSEKKDLPALYKEAEDLAGTKKMLRKFYEEDDHLPDQLAFAKARLFDIFINDRDRHQDQWEWAVYKENGNTIYKPIAKDRDQAFYNYDKGLTSLLLGKVLHMQKFQAFAPDYRNLRALTFKSVFIDRRLLNSVTQAQFDSIARELQLALTDAVIEDAVRAFPEEVYSKVGSVTAQHLKSRRDKLTKAAAMYYKILAKDVLVTGSDDEERFEVKRLNEEQTEVTVYRDSDKRRVYYRLFNHHETEVITLLGLGDDDVFEVSGSVKKGILINLVGGQGEDKITDTSRVAGRKKKTRVYDTKNGNNLKLGPETKDKTSRCVTVHEFDREGF